MAFETHQAAVAEFHRELAQGLHGLGQHGGHGGGGAQGHDMYVIHLQWHVDNRDPTPRPRVRTPSWGEDLAFGTNFLQMHHEMVKVTDDEPRQHMQHSSLVSWYGHKQYALPAEWNPTSAIPTALAYAPDATVFPADWGVNAADLPRTSNAPAYPLPSFFTAAGGAAVEPITRATRLADFRNVNQLGCVLVHYHNLWHNNIGGAMGNPATAIADPIFYFGVHWHIDRVFDEYKAMPPAARTGPRGARDDAELELAAVQLSPTELQEIELADRLSAQRFNQARDMLARVRR